MKLLRSLGAGLLLRRVLRAPDGIEAQLKQQNRLLIRLADHFAPDFPAEPIAPAESSVDFLDPTEAGLVLDYIDRTQRDTGRAPTDEEVLRYLADEKTIDLAQRLGSEE